MTIAILIFLHVPFWLLRDLHRTGSAVLKTKHFGPQSICSSSVSPATPFASPLPYFASKSNRGPGTEAAGLHRYPRKLLYRPLAQLTTLTQSTDSDDDTLSSYQYMYLSPCFLEASLSWWGWAEAHGEGQSTDKPNTIQLDQDLAKYGHFLTALPCKALKEACTEFPNRSLYCCENIFKFIDTSMEVGTI